MWKKSYLVGVDHIDKQHMELFRIVEELLLSLKATDDKADYKTGIGEAIAFLKGYVIKHFSDEEDFMASIGYKDIEQHKAYHAQLKKDVLSYENQLGISNFAMPIVKKFLGFVNVWLVQHVAGIDQKYSSEFVQEAVSDDYVAKITEVIKMMTGNEATDIIAFKENKKTDGSSLSFIVGLNNLPERAIAITFSEAFTSSVFKSMTGMEFEGTDDIVISAMSEIASVIARSIVSIVSGNRSDVNIKVMVPANSGAFSNVHDVTYLKTSMGDMAVFIINMK